MRRPLRRLSALLTLTALSLFSAALATRAQDAGGLWTLVWSDEFSGKAGIQPSEKSWNYQLGNADYDGWGNHELESYTRSPDNVRLDGQGNLEVRAMKVQATENTADLPCWNGERCLYTSARLTTEAKVQLMYGKVEARLRVPPGLGYMDSAKFRVSRDSGLASSRALPSLRSGNPCSGQDAPLATPYRSSPYTVPTPALGQSRRSGVLMRAPFPSLLGGNPSSQVGTLVHDDSP